jgi:hypothetical protein
MASRKWTVLPGGRLKRWNASARPNPWGGVPPHWYRNGLNRKERRRVRSALRRGEAERFPYVHPSGACWYW